MIPNKIGRYEIKSQIGQGGMATVFLAHDPDMHREVAITLFLRKRSAFLFKVDITHANRGHFYSQNDLNSTFPNK